MLTAMDGHDAVVHFAAETPRRPLDRRPRTRSSAPTASAPTCCATSPAEVGVGRFLHISTDEVYGSIEDGSFTRDRRRWRRARRTRRRRPAATSSRSATTPPTACRSWSPGARTTSARTSSRRRSSRCSPPTCSTARTVPLYGDGGNVRDWILRGRHNSARRPRAAIGHGRRDLQHRCRQRDHQPRAHPPAARAHRARRELHQAGRRSPRPRPPLLDHARQDHGARLEAPSTTSTRRWPRRSSGTATTARGGSR